MARRALLKFLDHAMKLVARKGGQVTHCDITIICEKPKVGPHREAMIARLAEIMASMRSVSA